MSASAVWSWAVANPALSVPLGLSLAWNTLVWKPNDPHGHTYKHSPRGSKGYESRAMRRQLAWDREQSRKRAIAKRDGGGK